MGVAGDVDAALQDPTVLRNGAASTAPKLGLAALVGAGRREGGSG